MKPDKKVSKAPKGTLRKVLRFARPYLPLIALSLILALLTVAGTLLLPVLVGKAVDAVMGEGQVDMPFVTAMLFTMALAAIGAAVCRYVMTLVNNRVAYGMVKDIRASCIRKIEVLPLSYLDTHAHGDTASRVMTDADQFADGLLLGFSELFTGVITIFGTLGFMATVDVRIALVVVLLTPLSLVAAKFIASRTYALFRAQAASRADETAFVDEMLENIGVVKAFGVEERVGERFARLEEDYKKKSLAATFYASLTNPSTRFVNSVVYALVALTGALAVLATRGSVNPFTVGDLTCFLSYANQYTKPFNEISGVVTELQNAFACAARVFEFLEEAPQVPDARDALVLDAPRGEVTVKDVSFSYVPEKPLIEHLSVTAREGMRVAIVGPTGCGKTTLIGLLMRFYDVKSGSIGVDGTDIRCITRASLRRSYGMVLQETWLSAGTVRENLCMGRPDATEEEMIAAAKASHAHAFIVRMPEGYDTVIGEDGGSLSQGEKQLLCIARVMLSLPPMLILDEATSSIDTRTERKIQDAFAVMMKGRTSFIVAHRLSTVKNADVILVMRDGHIVEQGTHEALLEKGGFYAQLYNSQWK